MPAVMKGQAIDKDPDSTVAEKGHINPKAPEFVSVISLEEPKAERKDGPIANSSSNSSRLQSPDDSKFHHHQPTKLKAVTY